MNPVRTILHVDMDAFFASVEQLDNPEMRGKPVLVGSPRRRGVVAAASYEARAFGCHSAQPMAVARRLCPQAIIAPVRGWRYREVSEQVFEVFSRFAPLVEPLSMDEAFLDVTGAQGLFGPPVELARRIKESIRTEVKLTASVGVAPNKFLAKLASDLEKPDGLTVFGWEEVECVLPGLPISKVWGLGPVTARKFERIGIKSIGDLRQLSESWLIRRFGSMGGQFYRLARGWDDRPVIPDSQAKSISHEQTFESDLEDPADVRAVLLPQTEQVARRLRKHGLRAKSVSVKIRYGNFKTITRGATLHEPTSATRNLWCVVSALFEEWSSHDFHPVRLIGMAAGDLASGPVQRSLLPGSDEEVLSRIDRAADQIIDRFGPGAIESATSLGNRGKNPRQK